MYFILKTVNFFVKGSSNFMANTVSLTFETKFGGSGRKP